MSPNLILQYLLPKDILSWLVAKIATCKIVWVKNFLIAVYIRRFKVDLSDAAESNYLNYQSLSDFFTRALKPEARPIVRSLNIVLSPVDGTIYQMGKIDKNQIIIAKGRGFSVEELLGEPNQNEYYGGSFIVLYLSPSDYHRIHAPVASRLILMRHIPGSLFSVNPKVTDQAPKIFAKNERVVNIFADKSQNKIAVVLVGAMIVGSIETKWHRVVNNHANKQTTEWHYSDQNINFDQGDELGRFNFGSTVILLFPPQAITWNDSLKIGNKVKMGEIICNIKSS